MTLLYMDGFAHGQSSRYTTTGPATFANTSTPRVTNGYYCTAPASATSSFRRSITATSEVFTGWGQKITGNSQQLAQFLGDTNATFHVYIGVSAGGVVEVRRGNSGGTVIATGSTAIPANAWTYYEARVIISDSVGVVQVRLNGSTSNEIDFSGDTKNAGTATTVDTIMLAGSSNQVADWYILDTNGSTNKTWLGDVTVRVLTPSGNGNSSVLVGSDGNSVDNYQQVDELPYASADYNGSATSGDKDSYAFSDLPAAVTTVYATQCGAFMAKSDASAKSAKILTRSGGTDYVPTSTTLTTSYVEYLELRETDPATSAAWAASAVNSAEFGMQVA